MHIGFFTDCYRPNQNGVVVSMESFAAELTRLGSEVSVFAPRPQVTGFLAQTPAQSAHPPGDVATVHWLPSVPLPVERSQRLALPVTRWIRRHPATAELDIVHTHTPFAIGYAAVQVARSLGIPIVHTYHTYYEEYVHYFRAGAPIARRITPAYSRWFCNLHDHIVAPSAGIREVLLDYGVRRPIEILHTGVDLSPLPDPQSRARMRSELGIAPDVPLLLFAGRIAREKNLDLLLSMLARLGSRFPAAELVLAGDGPDRTRLEREAEEHGLAHRVRFLGWVPHEEIRDLYAAADLFVSASVTETQGLSILEAMATGTAVIAARGPGVTDLIEHGVSGWLAAPTAPSLVEACAAILSDPALAARLAAGGRARAEALGTRSQAWKLYHRYEELARRARGSRRGLRGLAARAREEVAAWR